MNKIRTEVGDPVRAAQAADLGAIVTDKAAEDAWTAKAVAAGKAIPAFRTVDSIAGDLAAKRDEIEPSGKYEPTDEELYGSASHVEKRELASLVPLCDHCTKAVPVAKAERYDRNPNHDCARDGHFCSTECYDEATGAGGYR